MAKKPLFQSTKMAHRYGFPRFIPVRKNKKMTRLAFEHCGNKEYLRIHLELKPPEIAWLHSDNTSKDGKELKKKLLEIPGIRNDISTNDYSISLQRGGVFSWEEIKPQVVKVLSEFFNVKFTIVEAYPNEPSQVCTAPSQQQSTTS